MKRGSGLLLIVSQREKLTPPPYTDLQGSLTTLKTAHVAIDAGIYYILLDAVTLKLHMHEATSPLKLFGAFLEQPRTVLALNLRGL